MAGPYRNNMQENRIKSKFLYEIINIILLFCSVLFFKEKENKKKNILVFWGMKRMKNSRSESRVPAVKTFYLIILSS